MKLPGLVKVPQTKRPSTASSRMLKASLAPAPAPKPNLTQQIVNANLNHGQLGVVRASIQNGAKTAEVSAMVSRMSAPKLSPLKRDAAQFSTKPKTKLH